MTILTALKAYYDRLASRGDVPTFGYSTEGISFALELALDGTVVGRTSLVNRVGKKDVARATSVPQSFKRPGVTPRAFFLWDNTKFVLGLGSEKGSQGVVRFDAHRAAFRDHHLALLANTEDEGLLAVRRFVERWTPEDFVPPLFGPEMLDQNLAFMLEDDRHESNELRFVHDRPAARSLWERHCADAAGAEQLCLVTGQIAPVARLHPAIKGVWGAQTSGASLVSFNLDAFQSYGKEQGANAPVSEAAAAGYGIALNALLARDSENRIQIGDTTTVFWADAAQVGERRARRGERFVRDALAPPLSPEAVAAAETDRQDRQRRKDKQETASLRVNVLAPLSQGRTLAEIDPDLCPDTRFSILGLAPNSARLSVRFWYETELQTLANCLVQHGKDLEIDPPAWRNPPQVGALLYQTALQGKAENVQPRLGGEVMRAILTGGRYPRALLAAVILRIRAGEEINGPRAAICRACLTRDFRIGFEKEDVSVSLDREEKNAAYRLGRLFAVLENVQRAALGRVNASIRDRYFGAASATPSGVFPLLLRGANHHLSVLHKQSTKKGLAVWFENEIGQIMDELTMTLPRHLRLEEQGRFSVGYYHQRYFRKAPPGAAVVPEAVPEQVSDQTQDQE